MIQEHIGKTCPYCQYAIKPDISITICPGDCKMPHHKECWDENGGCTTFGCSESPAKSGMHHTPVLASSSVTIEDRYLVVATIDYGGMGAVYKALDMRLDNTPVAIKEMSTSEFGQGKLAEALEAFKKEASMLIKLRHPALPRITDYFTNGEDRWYIVMDYIEGETLEAIAQERGAIPEPEVIDWAKQLCGVLDYLHNQKPPVIFRDLKPANIMLTPHNEIKLIDFGIARHFKPGTTSDTTHYASLGFSPPEQYGEGQSDPRSDIYSLGATMHYLLTGIDPSKNPFMFNSPLDYGYGTPALNETIMKATEIKIEQRTKSFSELFDLLTQSEPDNHSKTEALHIYRNIRNVDVKHTPKERLLKVAPFVGGFILLLAVLIGVYNYLPITELTLNHDVLEIEIGDEEVVLSARVKPIFIKDKVLVWESSDPNVADVSNAGVVSIKDVGLAVLTVRTEDGSHKATCEIEVVYPTIAWNDGIYVGQLENEIPNGQGEWVHPSEESYSGHWKAGAFNGEGKHILPDGQVFAGVFIEGVLTGEGSWSNSVKDKYLGEFLDSKKHGQGVYTWADGAEYTGEFKEGLKQGMGLLTDVDGKETQGEWKDDEYVKPPIAKEALMPEIKTVDSNNVSYTLTNMHDGMSYVDLDFYVNGNFLARVGASRRVAVNLPRGNHKFTVYRFGELVYSNNIFVEDGYGLTVGPPYD